jgi:hypothetical protein
MLLLLRDSSELKRADGLRQVLQAQERKKQELFKSAGIKPHL